MENMPSVADIAAITGGNNRDGFGGGGAFFWIFALLILMAMFGGGSLFGNNAAAGRAVTEADLCNSQSFTELKAGVARNGDAIANMYTGLQNGLSNFGYETLRNFNTLEQQISACCCEIQRSIDNVRFDMANYVAGINANIAAGTQRVLDKLCDLNTQSLQNRVNQLELQSAMCGVVRYPNGAVYSAGGWPFGRDGCGYGNGCWG